MMSWRTPGTIITFITVAMVLSFRPQMAWSAPADKGQGDEYLGHGSAEEVVVAKVNGKTINMAQLMKAMAEISRTKHGSEEVSPLLADKIRREATDKLIVEELALQKAAATIKSVPPERMEEKIQAVRKKYKTEEEFQKYIKDDYGDMTAFRDYMERYLPLEMFILQEFGSKVTVNEQEIAKAYEQDKTRLFVTEEFVQVNDLSFFLDPDAPESLDKIEKVKQTIIDKYDNDPRKLPADGSTALEKNKPLDKVKNKELYEAARGLKEYGWTAPILVDGTLHIAQLVGYKPAINKSLKEATPYLTNDLIKRKRQDLLNSWMAGLKQGATIEIMDLTQ